MHYLSLKTMACLRILTLCTLCLFATLPSMATPKKPIDTIEMTLESAIKHTLAHAPNLHEFAYKQQALKGGMQSATLKPALIGGIEVENILGTGELSGVKSTELTVTLSSIIEFGDKRTARGTVISVLTSVDEVQKQLVSLELLAEVTRRYIDVLAQQALVSAQQEAETLARYTYQAVTKRVEAGASPAFEQKRASAALARARLEVLTAEQSKHSKIRSLAIMWGEQAPTFTQVTGDLYALQPSPALSVLFAQLVASPNLLVFAQQTRLQEAQVRLTQSANQADLNWTAGIKRVNGLNDTAFVAGISLPLFSGERNLGEYQKQQAMLGQLEQQKQQAVLQLYHQLNMALMARDNALLNVQTLQNSIIPPLQEALTWVEQTYIDGRFSYLEWVSTSQELLNAKQELIHAAKQAHQRGADIEALTAQPLVNALNTSLSSNPHEN